MGVNDLVKGWRDWAMEQVPPEYAGRDLHYKYLKSDCEAAGMDTAADELQQVAHTAWHPISKPPTEEDSLGGLVMVCFGEYIDMMPWDSLLPEDYELWARVKDVVLLPPEK